MSRRRFLVTGAASGIGRALRTRLAALGHDVVAVDRTAADGIIVCDLTNAEAIDRLPIMAGTLDGIAHVAGLPGTQSAKAILSVNFLAVRRLTKALLPQLRAEGSILAVSSITSRRCSLEPEQLAVLRDADDREVLSMSEELTSEQAYATSKSLLNGWVRASVATLLKDRIRINAIAPGPVETPLLDQFRKSMGEDRIEAAKSVTGRHGAPAEIADACAFLLSDAARWVNGVILPCDGGYCAVRETAETDRGLQ